LIEAFEQAWHRGERPAITDYLPAAMPARIVALVELVHADLELRIKAGEAVRIESYLTRYPQLEQRPGALVELAAAEYDLRRRLEPNVAIDGYLERFPAYREELLRRLQPEVPAESGGRSTGIQGRGIDTDLDIDQTGPDRSNKDPENGDGGGGGTGAPARIRGYEILGVLGKGGMGIVYEARHLRLNRLVALKMILGGPHADQAELARFRIEAEAVARVQHPHIIQVYEVGEADGRPYFSLGFCAGGSLASKLNGTPLPAQEAARLMHRLAEAMHAAHQRGIVHRDLKPANVLLTAEGSPKIGDFGLAKRLDDSAGLTATGAVMGTPSYMAPEQAAGKIDAIGPATDVYALGAILYECLTGRPPFKAATPWETIGQVLADEPVPPGRLQSRTPRDLETICLKCLQKEPSRRYVSALALAEDLDRFLTGQPVRARPVGEIERAAKWVRRRPAIASLLAALAVVTLVGVGGIYWKYLDAEAQKTIALGQTQVANQQTALAKDSAEKATAAAKEAREKGEAEARARAKLEWKNYSDQIGQALQQWNITQVSKAREMLDACRWDFRGWEHDYLYTQFNENHRTMAVHSATTLALSPDGKRLASAGTDGKVKIWEIQTGQEIHVLRGHTTVVKCVAFRPDGQLLASASQDGTVKIWEAQTGQEMCTLHSLGGAVNCVAFSPDGNLVAGALGDSTVKIWKPQNDTAIRTLKGHMQPVNSVGFSPDGKYLASGSWDGTARIWGSQSDRPTHTLRGDVGAVFSVAFSPDGQRLATAGQYGAVKIWQVETGKEILTLTGPGVASCVTFSADGQRLASAHFGTVRVCAAQTGQEIVTLHGHGKEVGSVAFMPDNKSLISGSVDGTVKLWDLQARPETGPPPVFSGNGKDVAISPDGQRWAEAFNDGMVKIWDARSGSELRTFKGHVGAVLSVAFSTDSKRLASAGQDGAVKVWETQTGQEILRLSMNNDNVNCVTFSPDGRRLVSGSGNGTLKVWDSQTGQEMLSLQAHTSAVASVAFSPDGRRLVSGSGDNTIKVWDAQSGHELRTLQGHTGIVTWVTFSPNGKQVASAGHDKMVKLWQVETGQEVCTFLGYSALFGSVAFNPDGNRLVGSSEMKVIVWETNTGQSMLTLNWNQRREFVTFSSDGKDLVGVNPDRTVRTVQAHARQNTLTLHVGGGASPSGVTFDANGKDVACAGQNMVKIWDLQSGQEALSLPGHHCVAFSSDGQHLASGSQDGTVRVWEAQMGQEILALRGHTMLVNSIAFTVDGQSLASGDADGTVKVWDLAHGQESMTLKGNGAGRSLAFSPDGNYLAVASGWWLKVWNAKIGQLVRTLKGHTGIVWCVAFSPDGKRLASASADWTVKLWDTETGKVICTLNEHSDEVRGVAFSSDGRRVVSASRDGSVKVWDARTGQEIRTLREHNGGVMAVAVNPDGNRLASADTDGTVRLCDIGTMDEVERHSLPFFDVQPLFDELVRKRDVLDHLRRDAKLDETSRQIALRRAEQYKQRPETLNEFSWAVVREPDASLAAYGKALLQAQVSRELAPGNSMILNTLGVAQYRAGQYAAAVETLTQSNVLNTEKAKGPFPEDLAFLAMAHHRLGHKDQAQALVVQLRRMLEQARWAKSTEARSFLREAETLVAGKPQP
jgi:WD40 repeat protein